jgi:hypothetical protein
MSEVAKVGSHQKNDMLYDVLGNSPQSRYDQHVDSGSRFERYDNQLSTPAWDRDEQQRSWAPQGRRGNSPREDNNNNKEQRMKELMAEFRPLLASGIRVDVVDVPTRLFSQCLIKLDMTSQTVRVTSAFMEERAFNIKEMTIYKGSEFSRKVPNLAHASSKCVGMEFQGSYWMDERDGEPMCLHFEESSARNDFFAFMKIMKMTADSVGPSGNRR